MMRPLRTAASAAVLSLAVACRGGDSGGGITPGLPVSEATPAKTNATFRIQIPARAPFNATKRRHFVTSSVTGISFSVTQQASTTSAFVYYALNPQASYCQTSGSGLTCTVNVQAPPGTDTFVVDLYDSALANGTEPNAGYIVSTGTLTQAIVAQSSNAINITTDGVPTFAVMGMSNAYPTSSGSYPVAMDIVDPDGNVIVGSFDAPLTLASSDPSVTLSPSTLNQTSDASDEMLTWSGTAIASPPAVVSMNSGDLIVRSESGSSTLASFTFNPNGPGVILAPPVLVFASTAAGAICVSATPTNGASLFPGSTTDYPLSGPPGNNCSDVYADISGFSGGYTVTPLEPTVSTGNGSNVGTCDVGIIDSDSNTYVVPVLIEGPTPAPTPTPHTLP